MDSEGHLHHHQETTDSSSNALTPVNRTVTVAAHVFCKFIPGALFHQLISRSMAVLPTNSVILSHPNSPPKSSNPWGSLALCHIHCNCQQNHLFRTSIYKIPACQSTFAPIANALSLAQSSPSWVFSHFGLNGVMRVSPCGSEGPVLGALRGSRVE